MADPLSIAAGVAGLLTFAAQTLTKGYGLVKSLKGSNEQVKQMLAELSQLAGVLAAIEAQEKTSKARAQAGASQPTSASIGSALVQPGNVPAIFNTSIRDCKKLVKKVSDILDKLDKNRKAVLAIKWQLIEPEVKKTIEDIEHYRMIFVLCLGVDLRRKTDQLLDLQKEIAEELRKLKNDRDTEKESLLKERAQRDREALFKWLTPKSEEKHTNAAKLLTAGTGTWIIAVSEYMSWKDGLSSLLWLRGIAGSGKTVLMSRIVNEIKDLKHLKKIGLGYYYCSYKESDHNSVLTILLSLAANLIRCVESPEATAAMKLYMNCDQGTSTPSTSRVMEIITELANNLDHTYICLDAVDELRLETKNELLPVLFELVGNCNKIGILVSSRKDDPEVDDYLNGSDRITISTRHVTDDIELYIRNKAIHGQSNLRQALSKRTIQSLIQQSDGMFLWASSQIEQLSRLKTKGAIEAALTSLPRGLYDTYHRILNEIPREHETISLRALQWLAHSTSPLDLEDLVEAIAIELNDDCKNLDQLDRLITPEDIFQICSSLVRRSEVTNKLSLAHHSVYEYLTLDSTKDDVPTPYHIPLPACQKYLTLSCLKYLSLDQFKSTSPQFNAEETIKLPFLRYALTNWWKHLPSDQSAMDEIWPSLEIFFDNNSGAFASSMVLLRQLEGEYRYPASIKPIHFCTMHGVAPLFPFLLKSSVPIDQPLEDGRRSIHIAAENGREDMVNLLLCHHIDTSVQTFDGRTPLQLAMETGSEEITSQLITGGVDINLSFSTGDIPLTLAVANNWYPVIQSLLENGADVNLALLDGRTALHIAAEAGANDATLILLLDRGADVYSEDLSRWTPLHYCTHFHHVSLARMILKENVNYLFDGKRWGPLHMAVEEENDELLELFEEFALNISIDAGRQYPLDMQSSPISDDPYAGMTDEELVRMKKGKHSGKATLPMRYRESSGEQLSRSRSLTGRQSNFVPSPLLLAVSQSYLPGIDILLRAGVDDRDLKFSMWHLFSQGNSEVLYKLTVAKVVNCRIFLDFETGLAADTAKIPHSVNSYLQSWGITRHIDLIRLLLAKCSIPISNENLECLKALVTKLPPHATLGQHQAKLVECLKEARKTHTAEVVEIFVEYGADWKELARDEILTLVSPAIISGNATLVKALLKHLAQTFGPNSWALPRPWLMAAAGNGFQNIVQTLLEAGAQWKDLTHNQMFSVIESITTRGVDRYYFSDLITQYLRKEHGADSDEIRDRDLKTRANAIIKVMLNQTHDAVPQMFESFVRAGIEIESGVRFQNATRDPISLITTHGPRLLGSLLHCAVLARNTRILSFLLEHDLKPDRRDSMGRTALHYAVQVPEGDIIVSLLLFKGADPCAGEGDNDGISPLHVSIAYGMDSHTQTLLNVGASLYQQDKSGRTPLHYCVSAFVEGVDWPSPLIETLLLDGGLQRMRSNDGLTPMEAALYASLQKTSSTLIEAVLKQDPDLATRVLPSGCTALHDAARMNCPNSVLQALLTNGASVRALDRSGRTPIDIAQVEAKEYLQSRRR